MILLTATMLWTIFWGSHETVLQFGTKESCLAAIEDGLPYSDVPPKSDLSCALRPDNNPVEICTDGSAAYLAHGESCLNCIDKNAKHITSVLCEAHGYQPDPESHTPYIPYGGGRARGDESK